jgi:hypothetical protein
MNRNMKTIFKIPLYFISFSILISAAGCSFAEKVNVMPAMQYKADFEPKEHEVVIAETRTLDKFLNVDALVSYDDSEELSFKLDYFNLKAVYVNEDEPVQKGQLLAELDSTDLEYRIAARQIDLERVQLMYDKIRSGADMEPDDKNAELKSLELDMESIKLDITYIKDLISKTQLIAPFSGVITHIKDFQPGEAIQAYDSFLTIWKPGSYIVLSVILNPYEASGSTDLSGIVTGMQAECIFGSMNKKTEVPATITKIINTDPGIQSNPKRILAAPPPFLVSVKPDGEYADKLILDSTVTLRINTGKLEDVVVLPISAIRGFGEDLSL